MKLFKRSHAATPVRRPSEHAQRLAGVRGLVLDQDERPSREDADYGQTIFNRPPLPGVSTGSGMRRIAS